jgi:hypothetical protein
MSSPVGRNKFVKADYVAGVTISGGDYWHATAELEDKPGDGEAIGGGP